jgi:hypothetical protein
MNVGRSARLQNALKVVEPLACCSALDTEQPAANVAAPPLAQQQALVMSSVYNPPGASRASSASLAATRIG